MNHMETVNDKLGVWENQLSILRRIVVEDFKLRIARPMGLFFLNKKSYRRMYYLTSISKKYYRAFLLF